MPPPGEEETNSLIESQEIALSQEAGRIDNYMPNSSFDTNWTGFKDTKADN